MPCFATSAAPESVPQPADDTMPAGMHRCRRCGPQPVASFTRHWRGPSGLDWHCRACRAVARALDRAARTEAVRAGERERERRRFARAPDAVRDARREVSRRRRRAHARAMRARYSAAGRAAFAALLEAAGRQCAYCSRTGVPLEADHFHPPSRGGAETVENVVPACRRCNGSKGNKLWPNEWRPLDPDARPNLALLAPHAERAALAGAYAAPPEEQTLPVRNAALRPSPGRTLSVACRVRPPLGRGHDPCGAGVTRPTDATEAALAQLERHAPQLERHAPQRRRRAAAGTPTGGVAGALAGVEAGLPGVIAGAAFGCAGVGVAGGIAATGAGASAGEVEGKVACDGLPGSPQALKNQPSPAAPSSPGRVP